MSTFMDISNDKLFKRRLTTNDSTTKFSNNNKSNASLHIRRTQLYSNNSNLILPSISINKKRNKYESIIDSETLMSKLIENYNPNKNIQTKEQSLETTKPLIKSKIRNTLIVKSQSLNDMFIPKRDETKFKSQRVLINNKNKSQESLLNNYNNSKNSSESDYDESFLNENDFQNFNKLNIFKNNNQSRNMKKSNSSLFITNKDIIKNKFNFNKKNISNLKSLNLENNNFQSNNSSTSINRYIIYRRLQKFNNILSTKSDIDKEKEKDNSLNVSKINNTKNNSSLNIEKDYISRIYKDNIKFQAKIFEEQVLLLNNSFIEYKNNYTDNNFIDVFKTKSLELKIKFNKTLEDACAILYYLPKLFLRGFHNLMNDLIKLQIPHEKKFRMKYINSEIDTVMKNNFLLAEVINYFNKSVEFFLILSKKENEAPELKLNQNNFLKIINYIKTARYNIIYLNNSFSNSKKKFLDDLIIIKNFLMRTGDGKNKNSEDKISKFSKNILGNVLLLENEKSKNISAIEKIERQFFFKKDEVTQKKKKIDIALDIHKTKIIKDHLGRVYTNKKDLFKSILYNKHLSNILKYCYDDIKNKIITEKITEKEKTRKKRKQYHKVVKFIFS